MRARLYFSVLAAAVMILSSPAPVAAQPYPSKPLQATTYQWQGMFAPGGTDKSIIDKLNEATNRALQAPDVVDRLVNKGGNEIVGGTPNDFLNVIKADFTRYSKLIKEANITPE